MEQRNPDRNGQVPDEELAEIARYLRNTFAADTPPVPTPPARPGAPVALLRFVAAFVAPGLILLAALLVRQMLG